MKSAKAMIVLGGVLSFLGAIGQAQAQAPAAVSVPAAFERVSPFSPRPLDPELTGITQQQTVVLLTSLNLRVIPLFIRGSVFHNYFQRLERAFRAHFAGQGFRIKVIHEADQYALWSELKNPNTVGLFWLSHSAPPTSSSGGGLGSDGGLVDYQSLDVMRALEGIHPNLRYLGVIGCRSEEALNLFMREHHILDRNPGLTVKGFDHVIDAKAGLLEMIADSDRVLNRPDVVAGYESTCPVERGFGLRVSRRIPVGDGTPMLYPAMRVETREQVLGVFESGWDGALQQMIVNVPERLFEGNALLNLKIMANVGDNYWRPDRPLEVGSLSFQAGWPGATWGLYAREDGSAIGVTSQIYRYRGERTLQAQFAEEYRPFLCQPVPARLPNP